MTDVTRDKVCLIYSLMRDDININVGPVILSSIKKARYHQECRYRFGGLLTRFLWSHEIEEEALDYRPLVDTLPIDVTWTKGLDVARGPVLTLLERHVWDDDITTRTYGLQMLQLRVGG